MRVAQPGFRLADRLALDVQAPMHGLGDAGSDGAER